jgi:hypothetical protein
VSPATLPPPPPPPPPLHIADARSICHALSVYGSLWAAASGSVGKGGVQRARFWRRSCQCEGLRGTCVRTRSCGVVGWVDSEMVSCAGQQPSCGCRITMTLPQTLRQRVAVSAFLPPPGSAWQDERSGRGCDGCRKWDGMMLFWR